MTSSLILFLLGLAVLFTFGMLVMLVKCFRKVDQGKALVRNGIGGPKVSFSGIFVIPIMHKMETMDISVKRIEISRTGKEGLICSDNMRADIKVAFFVRVNKTSDDVLRVSQSLGCIRGSEQEGLVELFESKFSEALKTVGKKFQFVELYDSRDRFKSEILQIIGTDLNGYVLDDCAIDFLEQTDLRNLNPDNILDSEGIKKITELTAKQKILSNQIDRGREMTIKKQNVEAEEAVLEMDRQLEESREKQKREIASIKARETADTMKVQQEERRKAEAARISTEEEIRVSEENRDRQVIVARKNKERTEAVETERVEKDRKIEATERERIVALAQIERDRAIEEERKNIQEVIRERVVVEKAVVEEEERIKDTRAFAEADRAKKVAVTHAEREALESKLRTVIAAEAERDAASNRAQQRILEAEAGLKAADKEAESKKVLAEAMVAEEAAHGLAEVKVLEARARAIETQGSAEAVVIERKASAEAKGVEVGSEAHKKRGEAEASVLLARREVEIQTLARQGQAEAEVLAVKAQAEARGQLSKTEAFAKQGEVEAEVLKKRAFAEALGIAEKARAMRELDSDSRTHEEFRLRIGLEKEVALARMETQREIADAQAHTIQEGLKAAKIEIVGGDTMFFDKIVGAMAQGRAIDHMIGSSEVLKDVKNTFFGGDLEQFRTQVKRILTAFGVGTDDIKNLGIAALCGKLLAQTGNKEERGMIEQLQGWAERLGLGEKRLDQI